MLDLEKLQVFVTVVEEGSFSAAADKLNISQPSVSRQITVLEKVLGTSLINRSTRSVSLTEIGKYVYGQANQTLQLVRDTQRTVSDMQNSDVGEVKITVPTVFFRVILAPLLAGFYEEFPNIRLSIQIGNSMEDLVAGAFDLAIRVGPLNDSRLFTKRLFNSKLKLCASQEYLERRGVPMVPADLSSHTLLYGRQSNVWYFNRDGDTEEVTIEPTKEPYDSVVHYYSVVSGVGAALFPEWVSVPSIASGSLVSLLDDYDIHTESPAFCSAHIVTVNNSYAKKTRCFIDYLVGEMSTQYNLS